MPGIVVREVPSIDVVADDEELHEAQERAGVAVAGIVLVIDDLLHRSPGADAERLELDLNDRHAIHEQDDVVAVVAVVGVDAELVDDLERVLAPVLDIDEGVIQRRAVVAGEAVDGAERASRGENSGVTTSSSRRWNSSSVSLTRFSSWNFSRKLASSAARLRMSGRYSYFRLSSF